MFNGTIVWSAGYRPFGRADVTVNTIANNFRFPGQYWDQESGLHYNWHRYYDPEIGRYLRADPIGLDGGINLFSYVQNDPVGGVDPWGLWDFPAPGHLPDPGPMGRAPYPLPPAGNIPLPTITIEPGAWDFILYGAAIGSSHIPYLAIAPACGLAGAIPGTLGISGIVFGSGIMLQGFSMIDISFDCPEDPCE